jgi:eukaryotic-like serine/threonine-protein kinase
MPLYTRHGIAIPVPDVMSQSFDTAALAVTEAGLIAEEVVLRKPNLPRNVVIDQNPKAGWTVKPGRRIYLTVNSGDTTTVIVPKVEALSVREATNRIAIHGLVVADVQPDSIPSLHANTVTKQVPEEGKRVDPGTPVSLWYSTGLGQQSVLVPTVVGMKADSASVFLLSLRLRSVLIGAASKDRIVSRQSPEPGTSVREGSEIRLHADPPDEDG